ncbi:MAG: hypothetical protein ABJF50_06710 [Paracoccaceae bacterium]
MSLLHATFTQAEIDAWSRELDRLEIELSDISVRRWLSQEGRFDAHFRISLDSIGVGRDFISQIDDRRESKEFVEEMIVNLRGIVNQVEETIFEYRDLAC